MALGRYDHGVHAGNAGDVWKHLLLQEAAAFILQSQGRLVYAESHSGRPHYILESPGEWQGGLGRTLPLLPSLQSFSYFRMLSELNPSAPEICGRLLYPGSARQIYELARSRGTDLQAEIWDSDPDVAESWQGFLQAEASRWPRPEGLHFHPSDGFSGVLSLLGRPFPGPSPVGLLFIDPPYIDPLDLPLAERLLQEARDRGWIVLWWYMMDLVTAPESADALELHFADVGMEGGRWNGAGLAVAGEESGMLSGILQHLKQRAEEFMRILKSD